jgi:hypothetical protein
MNCLPLPLDYGGPVHSDSLGFDPGVRPVLGVLRADIPVGKSKTQD